MASTQTSMTCPDCKGHLDPRSAARERSNEMYEVAYCPKCQRRFQRRIIEGEPPHPWQGITHYKY